MKSIIVSFVALLGLALLAAGCGGETQSTPAATAASSTPSGNVREVRIVARDNMFEPVTYTVEGTSNFTIVAVNEGTAVHEVEVKGLLPETKLSPGQSKTVEVTNVQPGTYKVYCEIHEDQGMEGELIVK